MRASASDGPTYRRLFPRIIITILTLMIFCRAVHLSSGKARAGERRRV